MSNPVDSPFQGSPANQPSKTFAPPPELCGGAELVQQKYAGQPGSGSRFSVAPYLVGGSIAALILFMGYQQFQIAKLNHELAIVSDNLKTSDFRTRLDSHETALQEVNKRLTYLDSKINATNQKAQVALDKLKAQEENDIFGNFVKNVKQTLGFE